MTRERMIDILININLTKSIKLIFVAKKVVMKRRASLRDTTRNLNLVQLKE